MRKDERLRYAARKQLVEICTEAFSLMIGQRRTDICADGVSFYSMFNLSLSFISEKIALEIRESRKSLKPRSRHLRLSKLIKKFHLSIDREH